MAKEKNPKVFLIIRKPSYLIHILYENGAEV